MASRMNYTVTVWYEQHYDQLDASIESTTRETNFEIAIRSSLLEAIADLQQVGSL